MQLARKDFVAEIPEVAWPGDLHRPIKSDDNPEKTFNPFTGICLGLGLGLVSWGLMFLVWYAFFA